MKEYKTINQNKVDMEIGYKQEEQMYSEEDIKNAFFAGWELRNGDLRFNLAKKKWFNEFKKQKNDKI
jgi:hypothetical protein